MISLLTYCRRSGIPSLAVLLILMLTACTLTGPAADEFAVRFGSSAPKDRQLSHEEYLNSLAAGKVSYQRDVKPILDSRCVVCHGCYDGPCQLKLESPRALDRGASKQQVYASRLDSMAPSRMGVDAPDTRGWRGKGFFPVLNERSESPVANQENSLLAQMLLLKLQHPLPSSGVLPDEYDFTLERTLECPMISEFDAFASRHPGWGMPYGLPGLTRAQHQTMLDWISQGARYETEPPLPPETQQAVERWESFLNGSSLKQRLMARYVYEHLFIGHLHFKGHAPGEFFRLVRSTTPTGQPVREIASLRPYDYPGKTMYYRLKPFQQTIVDKNHDVYEIGDERIKRLQELFLQPVYEVKSWPGYISGPGSNPFQVFKSIPPSSRYRFMLDDAHYFISGFMKGPVCRGQVALNVIRDQFWIIFYDPEKDPISKDEAFINSKTNLLRLPTEQGDRIGLDDLIVNYTREQNDYLKAKNDYLAALPDNQRNTVDAIWDGGGANPNAALTAFRHFDSASLMRGLVGGVPQTAWLVDYPLFERIHYLLVAGFNVFGPVTHQAATRIFMDKLRMEGENNFLSLMPASARPAIYRGWNRGLLAEIKSAWANPYYGYGKDSAVTYTSRNYEAELFTLIQNRLGPLKGPDNTLYRCSRPPCDRLDASPLEVRAERLFKPLTFLQGGGIHWLPELSFVRVHDPDAMPAQGVAYSLVVNKALENVSFMFLERSRRIPEEDTLTVTPGFAGSYPNFYFDVDINDLPDFISRILNLGNQQDVDKLIEAYGIRRSHPDFWVWSDFFNQKHIAQNPVTNGLFDLNRYENR